jgi:NAD(P)-dependent dehydrogenase (short-subunit alcohol dehydrogenase family)
LHHSVHHDRGAERPGARKDEDLAELSAIENIQGVRLDVNKQEQIDAAVKTISKAGRGLYGLVNNAGVVVVQPLMEIDEQDFDFQMNADISDLGTVLHDQICHGSLCRRAG